MSGNTTPLDLFAQAAIARLLEFQRHHPRIAHVYLTAMRSQVKVGAETADDGFISGAFLSVIQLPTIDAHIDPAELGRSAASRVCLDLIEKESRQSRSAR